MTYPAAAVPLRPDRPLRVAMIIGSTREGRAGARVGRWFAERVRRCAGLTLVVLDLAEYEFPARYPAEATAQIAAFVAEIGRADAFVIVTPEYNHSFPASLKQAIDYAYDEWQAKPVGFVSYGCQSRGIRAADQLRLVFGALHAVSIRDGIGLDLLTDTNDRNLDEANFDGAGMGRGGEAPDEAVTTMLKQLCWWGLALREARAARPYVS
jgi:NAD(P)H-dependent FMN reductase